MPGPSLLVPLLLLSCAISALPQTAAELERRISTLPATEKAYERFRFWSTQLPAGQQSSPDLLDRYRAHLMGQGLSATEAAGQVKIIQEQGSAAEVQRWNRILTSATPRFNTEPNEFLVQMAQGRKPGAALDVGMGQGRNAIWLARQGWRVTGFDPAEKAVALAQATAANAGLKLDTEIKTMEGFDFGEARWDLILLSYVAVRGFESKLERALRPGGVLVIEGTHRDATKGRSIGGAVVFDTGELPRLFPNLRVVRYEEPVARADFGLEVVRLVRYCAERPVDGQ